MQTNNVRGYPTSRQTVACQRAAVPLLTTHDDRLEPRAVTNFRGVFSTDRSPGPYGTFFNPLGAKIDHRDLIRETTTTSS